MTTVLDLPIEKQKELAKQCGYTNFSLWQKEISKSLEETRTAADKLENSALSKEKAARMIHDLRTNPYAIEFYRRMTDNYDLTVEEQIAHLERVAR